MNMKNWLMKTTGIFARKPPQEEVRGIGGAVARKDDATAFGSYFTPIIARAGVQTSYAQFTEEILNTLPANKIRDLIRKSSPIVAKALADYSDAIASGFTWTSDKTLGQEPDIPQQTLISDFLTRIELEHVGMEQLIAEVARGMFSHGGVFMELIIDEDGRTPVALRSLDPTTAVFRKNEDPLTGEFYELGQDIGWNVNGSGTTGRSRVVRTTSGSALNFVSLHNDPTIQYRPIQSEPNNPYGTPILDPAVFHVIMMAGFFAAFKDALTGHVWPNLLITIDGEQFKKNAGVSANPKQLQAKLNAAIEDIQKNVQNLKPGGALIQGNEVALAGHLSGQNRAPLGSIKDIQDVIRRELIIAVQSQPVLMGSNEAIAETHAIEQLKSYGKLIRRSQKTLNALFTDYFNLILQLNDYPRLAEFRLSYVNTADYKDQAATFNQFRQGLLTASDDMLKFVEALDMAKESGYLNEAQAMEMWDEGMEIRRQLNILPQEL